MPQNNTVKFYDKDLFSTIVASQQGINVDYDPKSVFGSYSRSVEEQSAAFLESYVNGEIVLEPGTEDLMQSFLVSLKKSKYHRISSIVRKAEDTFKQTTIRQFKELEKANAFKNSHFKILNNKKEALRLSSKDMLTIDALLKNDLGYSTVKLQNKLRSFAEEKIRRTLSGEFPQDEDFAKLTECFGTYQQKQRIRNQLNPKPAQKESDSLPKKDYTAHIVSLDGKKAPETQKNENKSSAQSVSSVKKNTAEAKAKVEPTPKSSKPKKEKRISSLWGKVWKWTKRTAVVAGLAALGFFGGRFAHNQFNKTSNAPHKENTEVKVNTPVKTKKVVEDTKTADFSKELSALEKAYKNRFDTSLEIILGVQKRNQLYQKIDNLAKEGKIQYKDGTTREWYAHAFTMYNQLAPYSKENKVIKDLLAGKDVDKNYINSLVVKAGRNGKGIEASGSYSAFDKADKSLQMKHIKNRKAVKMAEKAAKMAQMQQTR